MTDKKPVPPQKHKYYIEGGDKVLRKLDTLQDKLKECSALISIINETELTIRVQEEPWAKRKDETTVETTCNYQALIDRVTALYNAGASGADFEGLQGKAVILLNIEVQKNAHTREYERLIKRLDDKKEELAEEIEAELEAIEAKLKDATEGVENE
jgi:hypothetical protein